MKQLSTIFIILVTARLLLGQCIAAWYNCDHFPPQADVWHFNPDKTILPAAWSKLYLMRGDSSIQSGKSYAEIVNSGIGLLAKYHLETNMICCLDFVNSFPMILGSQYPEGQPVFSDYRNSFDETNHETAEQFLGKATVILVPKFSNAPASVTALVNLYGASIQANFAKVNENDLWILLKRKSL